MVIFTLYYIKFCRFSKRFFFCNIGFITLVLCFHFLRCRSRLNPYFSTKYFRLILTLIHLYFVYLRNNNHCLITNFNYSSRSKCRKMKPVRLIQWHWQCRMSVQYVYNIASSRSWAQYIHLALFSVHIATLQVAVHAKHKYRSSRTCVIIVPLLNADLLFYFDTRFGLLNCFSVLVFVLFYRRDLNDFLFGGADSRNIENALWIWCQ